MHSTTSTRFMPKSFAPYAEESSPRPTRSRTALVYALSDASRRTVSRSAIVRGRGTSMVKVSCICPSPAFCCEGLILIVHLTFVSRTREPHESASMVRHNTQHLGLARLSDLYILH